MEYQSSRLKVAVKSLSPKVNRLSEKVELWRAYVAVVAALIAGIIIGYILHR